MTAPDRRQATTVAHLVWEAVLLVAAAAVWFVAYGKLSPHTSPFPQLLTQLALVGLPAAAIALSLRTATPNLAVGAIAGGAALLIAKLMVAGWSFWTATALSVAVGLGVGLVGAVIVGLLDVPGWVVSFALIAAITTAAVAVTSSQGFIAVTGGGLPSNRTFFNLLAGVFIVGSIGAGVLWQSGGVRRAFGGDRSAGERATLGPRLLGAVVGFGGAAMVAAVAGAGSLVELQSSSPAGLALPLLPLGAALLGGASVHGRRGGIAGTVLASAILVGVVQLLFLNNASSWMTNFLPGTVAITLGLGMSALFGVVESGFGAPPSTGYPATGLPYPSGPSGYAPGYQAPAQHPGFGSPQSTVVDRDSTDALPTVEQ